MKNLLLLICLSLLPCSLYSQIPALQGRVLDKENSKPLGDVLISHARTKQHVHTDSRGYFEMQGVQPQDSIIISSLGYARQTLVISNLQEPVQVYLAPKGLELEQVIITPSIKTFSTLAAIDLQLNPINSSQEVLRKVPGLFIGQHAGGGKAEQIFLRGFDIDHGTDIQITADGLPVNMVSHAHGQGYADLHFLIPETVEQVDFGKGPYYTSKGNFTTAGYVDFQTLDALEQSSIKLEAGRFNTLRMVGLVDLLPKETPANAYLATEYYLTDGPFESPQGFKRLNLFGKYTGHIKDHRLSLQASTFNSHWDASGQIPERAVREGMISRFGAIDDTEGGETSRTNLLARHTLLLDHNRSLENKLYYSHYDFELYSNFTFFLNDPINGDQIRQRENRDIYGFSSTYQDLLMLGRQEIALEAGTGFRLDQVAGNELSRTRNRRQTLDSLALGDIQETNGFLYTDLQWESGKWLVNGGLRVDHFNFNLDDYLLPYYQTQSVSKTILSPRFNLLYTANPAWQLYLKTGKGFHSNDTRVVVAQHGTEILPAAYGADLGTIVKPFSRLYLNAAVWYLYLEQEFVYVGDEGIVEPSGETVRKGVDLGLRYQLTPWLFADADINFTKPRALHAPEGEQYIPLAPTTSSTGGLSVTNWKGFSGSLRYRYLADRAASEDNSVMAEGYFLTDVTMDYQKKQLGAGITFENLFNTTWREAQFLTESRLQYEQEPVEEIHYTPGTPFFVKARLYFKF